MAYNKETVIASVAGLIGTAGAVLAVGLNSRKQAATDAEDVRRPELNPRIKAELEKIRETYEGKWGPDDGATAAAWVAYQMSDNAFIFPITPSTLMSEMCDTWMTAGVPNGFGQQCQVYQLQSEAGAAGAMHGALSVGNLATTFTASQGLLLMIPNMYKISGELLPCVMHISARALAGQALSIFGDQNDISAVRSTGFAILFGASVQEALDLALVAHIATLRSRVPFVHTFDGFRTSHEIAKIQAIPKEAFPKVLELLAPEIDAHRARGLNPNHPHVRGTAQCDDIYFQAVEASNNFYTNAVVYCEEALQWVEALTGRKYGLFEYVGNPKAKHVIICMGSGIGVIEEYLDNVAADDVGLVKVRLYRPFSEAHFLKALPLKTMQKVTILNKMKDPAAHGEPLYLDVCTCLMRARVNCEVINGRFGLSSKDFTPGMVAAIVSNSRASKSRHPFTVGLQDDVTCLSLPYTQLLTQPAGTKQCIFWGFGSDGTVGANKNTIKIIATNTPLYAQGYFKYDALKSGGITMSHLRFGPKPIKGSYLIDAGCDYLAIHKKEYIKTFQAEVLLGPLGDGQTLVLNCPWSDEDLETELPAPFRRMIGEKKLKLMAINANAVAKRTGMGKLINNIMTAVFFQLSEVLPIEEAIGLLKNAVKKTYKNKGDAIVNMNIAAVDGAIDALREVKYDAATWAKLSGDASVYDKVRAEKPGAYTTEILDKIQTLRGSELKVSQLEVDGAVPMNQTRAAKRAVADCVPVVDMDKCIQCNVCSAICPHAVIRPFLLSAGELREAPPSWGARKATGGNTTAGLHYRIQASPDDCTGCEVCTNACPVGALSMVSREEAYKQGHLANWNYAMTVPERGSRFDVNSVKGSQFQDPLLEFSGACEGCGETPYAKLITQMFGKRLIVANATGCSSIWGGTAGWVPYGKDKKTGKGTAWGNSLFEDNAEFGIGQFMAVQHRRAQLRKSIETSLKKASEKMSLPLRSLLEQWLEFAETPDVSERLSDELYPLLEAERGVAEEIHEVYRLRDLLTKPAMWLFGGDGWANDIGYGGIDHILASGKRVKVCIFDTEVYSNTGGQSSKATQKSAVAKFAQGGRQTQKKDLGGLAMAYNSIYVASVAMGANYKQCVEAFAEAEAFDGPALVICYSPCIEHRYFKTGLSAMSLDMKDAVECGYWPLYRFNPAKIKQGMNPFELDSKKITGDTQKYLDRQNRYTQLVRAQPAVAEQLQSELKVYLHARHESLRQKAAQVYGSKEEASVAHAAEVTILFGSDTGTTEQVAKKFAGMCAERKIKVKKTCDLDEVSELDDMKTLVAGSTVVILCATCGHGDFPQNAGLFWSAISADVPKDIFKDIQYCVFGLGDRSYHDSFCEAAIKIDERMVQLGANKLLDMGIGDDRDEDKWETGFRAWLPKFWKMIGAPEPDDDGRPRAPLFEIVAHEGASLAPYKICPPGAQLLQVDENRRLTPGEYERDIRHFTLSTKGADFPWDLGDAVAIYPENLPEDVDEALAWLNLTGEQIVTVKCISPNVSERHRRSFARRVTVRMILTTVLDLFGRPSRSVCADLARFASDAAEQKKLNHIAGNDGDGEWKKLIENDPSTFALMKMFPSARPPLEQLLSFIPLVKPRIYSIASDAECTPGQVEFTVVVNKWTSKGGATKIGTCTKFIQSVPVGSQVACSVICGTFHFPEKETTPLVMVGLGTGIAPIRSFMQYKLAQKKKGVEVGPMIVFYGCRREKEELLYKEEWEMFKKEGVLTALVGAFQFDTPGKQVFVGDKMAEQPSLISDNLIDLGGYFCMCGPAVATPSVQTALKNAVALKFKQTGVEGDVQGKAESWFKEFCDNHRYSEESY